MALLKQFECFFEVELLSVDEAGYVEVEFVAGGFAH